MQLQSVQNPRNITYCRLVLRQLKFIVYTLHLTRYEEFYFFRVMTVLKVWDKSEDKQVN